MSLDELALAYELRQAGCCWKRIAQGLGCDAMLLAKQVSHLVRNGIKKGLDGYARIGGRPSSFNLIVIRKAADMKSRGSSWPGIGRELDADPEQLRKAFQYAVKSGLIKRTEHVRTNARPY